MLKEVEDEEGGVGWGKGRAGQSRAVEVSVIKLRVSLVLEVLNEKVRREILPVDDGEPGIRELADAGCWVELEVGCWQVQN